MFNLKQKQEYLNGNKKYTKKGQEQSYHIGKLVKIDWDAEVNELSDKITSCSQLPKDVQNWVESQEIFVVTNTYNWGLGSTLELDHRFCISPFQLIDVHTGKHVWEKEFLK